MLILLFILQYTCAQFTSYNAVRSRLPGQCGPGNFDCGFGTCISITRFHDGKPDCFDGSDEWCFLGHIKCGQYCVELFHALSCIFNPKCDGSPGQPQWCTLSKEKLCGETTAFPCKGYGECVLWEWLLDGRKDCIDGSDEDSNYIRTFEPSFQCYFNATGQSHRIRPINYSTPLTPFGIPMLPPPPAQPMLPLFPPSHPNLPPCIVCPSPPFPVDYPNAIAFTTPNPFATLIHNQIFTSSRPKDPFEDIGDTSYTSQTVIYSQTTGYSNEYSGKEEHGDKWETLINERTSTTSNLLIENNFTNGIDTQVPLPSVITHIDLSSGSINWEELSQTSTTGIKTNEIENLPVFPDDSADKQEKQESSSYADLTQGGDEAEANVIFVKNTKGPSIFTSTSKPELSFTKENYVSYMTPINPIAGILPPITPVTLKSFTQNSPYIQINGINSEEELIPIHPAVITPYERVEVNTENSGIFDRLFSRTTTISQPTTSSTPLIIPITVDTISQTKEMSEETIKSSSVTKLSLTTSTSSSTSLPTSSTSTIVTSTENACFIELLEHSKNKYPQPLCDCQLGEIKINGTCAATTITTFKMDFDEVCGYREISTSDKRHLAFTRMRDAFLNPVCIRDTDSDKVVFNMLCVNNCNLEDIQKLILRDSNKLYLPKTEALTSLCSDDSLNYCHRYATCEIDQSGLQIKCTCKPGTNDTSSGLGRTCEGIPLEDDCIMVFGVCLIFWLILLFGLLVLIPLLIYLFYHCCPAYQRNTIHPDREAFERTDGFRNSKNRARSTMEGKNVAFIVAEALKSNARGTKALASSLTTVESMKKKESAKIMPQTKRVVEVESTNEPITSLDTHSCDIEPNPLRRKVPQNGLVKSYSSPLAPVLLRGEIESIPGTVPCLETPILDKGSPTFEISSQSTTPKAPTPVKQSPPPEESVQVSQVSLIKESEITTELNKDDAPTSQYVSESAPVLPLPAPVIVDIEVHRESEIKTEEERPMSAKSVGVQPTIWETYRVLGEQYTKQENIDQEDCSSSLEALILNRYPEMNKDESRSISINESEKDMRIVNPLPPLETMVIMEDLSSESDMPINTIVASSRSTRNTKLAEMLGVSLIEETSVAVEIPTYNVEDKSDEQLLVELSQEGINLPLSPRKNLIDDTAIPSEPMLTYDTSESTTCEQHFGIETPQEFEEITDKPQSPLSKFVSPPPLDSKEQILSSNTSGKSKVPISKYEKIRSTSIPLDNRTLSHNKQTQDLLAAKQLLEPPSHDVNTSTDESDPEVAVFKRLERSNQKNALPIREKKKKPRRPIRQLSSISEKSAEIAAEAALQEYHKEYSISAPNTTRSLSEWHTYLPRHHRVEYTTDEQTTDVDIPKKPPILAPLVTSPEIPDVTLRRSLERLDMFHQDILNDSFMNVGPSTSRKADKTSLDKRKRNYTTNKSFMNKSKHTKAEATGQVFSTHKDDAMIRHTHRESRPSIISRKIATRRHEIHVTQSARDLSTDYDTSTTLHDVCRAAHSVENLRNKPPLDLCYNKERLIHINKEPFFPHIRSVMKQSKSCSILNSLKEARKRSIFSTISLPTRSGSTFEMSPYFDPDEDMHKPPKEELWWRPPPRSYR